MPRPGRGVALCGDAREGDNQHRAGGVSTRRSSAGFSAARAGCLGSALPRARSDLVRNWPYLLHQVRGDGGCATLWSRWRTPPSKPLRADLLAEAGPPPICSARPARGAHGASVSPYAARDMEEPAVAIGAWGVAERSPFRCGPAWHAIHCAFDATADVNSFSGISHSAGPTHCPKMASQFSSILFVLH